jgi:hypothetical protein
MCEEVSVHSVSFLTAAGRHVNIIIIIIIVIVIIINIIASSLVTHKLL